jgi:hypothetical protein
MRKTLKISLLAGFAAAQLLAGSAAFARRGADDPVGHVRHGRGADDLAGDDSDRGRGRGTDDGPNHT